MALMMGRQSPNDSDVYSNTVPEPLPLVESLVDNVLDELDEMGTSLETVSSDQLLEARYSALDDLLHLPARRESRPQAGRESDDC